MRRPPTRWLVTARTSQPGQGVGELHWVGATPATRAPLVASAASRASRRSAWSRVAGVPVAVVPFMWGSFIGVVMGVVIGVVEVTAGGGTGGVRGPGAPGAIPLVSRAGHHCRGSRGVVAGPGRRRAGAGEGGLLGVSHPSSGPTQQEQAVEQQEGVA